MFPGNIILVPSICLSICPCVCHQFNCLTTVLTLPPSLFFISYLFPDFVLFVHHFFHLFPSFSCFFSSLSQPVCVSHNELLWLCDRTCFECLHCVIACIHKLKKRKKVLFSSVPIIDMKVERTIVSVCYRTNIFDARKLHGVCSLNSFLFLFFLYKLLATTLESCIYFSTYIQGDGGHSVSLICTDTISASFVWESWRMAELSYWTVLSIKLHTSNADVQQKVTV